jgi:hypothetical protein
MQGISQDTHLFLNGSYSHAQVGSCWKPAVVDPSTLYVFDRDS